MSIVSQVINQADEELRYPSSGELANLLDYFTTGEKRIRLACLLRDAEKELITKASQLLFKAHPDYLAPGGNASGAKQRALCLRDYGWYLRLITYAVIEGDATVLEKVGLLGVRDMYNSLGVPMAGMYDGIKFLKQAALKEISNPQDQAFVASYFDYLAEGMR
uniref:Allophycocyanin alpha-B subunit n=1 Tax=Cyanidiococcus yangmingshanensis TaxID=2690220 RepID=A0A7G5VUQ0_9RHOD|nr:allophycocyanin alpha-B subunit [Cyanidiococcus yangmingshanensis]QMX77417.1 allophycocyanin alpha-B subunit [Cyanidiococcus yangmingshanensis]